jgi:hypothetical protein
MEAPPSRPLNPFEAMMVPISFNITATFRIEGPVTVEAVSAALRAARAQHWAMQVSTSSLSSTLAGKLSFVPSPVEEVPLVVRHGCAAEAWRTEALQASVDGVDTSRGLFRALLLLHRPLSSPDPSKPAAAAEAAGDGASP